MQPFTRKLVAPPPPGAALDPNGSVYQAANPLFGRAAVSDGHPFAAYLEAESEAAGVSRAESASNLHGGEDTNSLRIRDFVLAEYVWLDAWGVPRSKCKVVHGKSSVTLKDLSDWNFDGSSTGQAPGEDSEVIIKPRALYTDPFRGAPHVLVMCDNWTPKGKPIPSNTRAIAAEVFQAGLKEEPWYGIEQEYVMFRKGAPLGWPTDSEAKNLMGLSSHIGYPGPQGPYYCSAGSDVSFGREVAEEHLKACNIAGINISGTNAEVMPGQWEYQVGPCTGIEAGDQHHMSRYILMRVAEFYNVVISFDPKPMFGDWNGSGCHTNFSTKAMRENPDALTKHIIPAIEKLGKRHKEHIYNYGHGNEKRLTGKHETASMHKFSWGVASRKASIRVGNQTAKDKRGYFEDRRPASNMDPYLVTAMIFDTAILNAKFAAKFPSPVKKLAVGGGGFSSEDMSEDGGYTSEGGGSETSEEGGAYSVVKKQAVGGLAKKLSGRKNKAGGEGKSGCSVIM